METNMPYIVLIPLPILKIRKFERTQSIPDNGPKLLLRLRHPHHLHLHIIPRQPNMNLLWARPVLRTEAKLPENLLELFQLDPAV